MIGGAITPLRFTWHGVWYSVAQIGRAWSDEEGQHWLVIASQPNLIVELVYTREGHWLAESKATRSLMV
jgi:hypothetical protein